MESEECLCLASFIVFEILIPQEEEEESRYPRSKTRQMKRKSIFYRKSNAFRMEEYIYIRTRGEFVERRSARK